MNDGSLFYVRYEWSGYTNGNFVAPEWTYSPGGRVHLVGLLLFTAEKRYVGYAYRHNLPVDTIRHMEKIIRERVPSNRGGFQHTMDG